MSQQTQEQINQAIDNKFVALMLQIEKRYQAPHFQFQKYEKIRIEQWCKKLCMVTQNLQWKKNRNLYAMLLLDQILNKKLTKPFIKMPTDDSLPVLSPTEVKSQFSDKFKKFQFRLDCDNAAEKLLNEEAQEPVKRYTYQQDSDRTALKNQTTNTSMQHGIPSHSKNKQSTSSSSQTPRQTISKKFEQIETQTQTNQQKSRQRSTSQSLNSQSDNTNQVNKTSYNMIKSILKHTTQHSKVQNEISAKHKFLLSPRSESKNKNLRFDAQQVNEEQLSDLDRQISHDMATFKINFQADYEQVQNQYKSKNQQQIYNGNLTTTGGETALMNGNELQSQVIKLKTDNEILNITLKHLQEEMNMKSEVIRKQNQEMQELRQMVLDLQSENQRFKNHQEVQKLVSNQSDKENYSGINQRVLSPAKYYPIGDSKNEQYNPFKTATSDLQKDLLTRENLLKSPKPQTFQSQLRKPQTFVNNAQQKEYRRSEQPIKTLVSDSYKSKQDQILQAIQTSTVDQKKVKRDGTVLRSKQEIIDNYDNSSLPEPVRSLVTLDYCWRLNYTMFRHSFIIAFPLTLTYHIWTNQPKVWSYSLRTIPYLKIGFQFATCVLLINALNVTWSMMFEEYCDRKSQIYDQKRGSFVLRNLIKETNDNHTKTLDGKSHKTLTEEEILKERS
eukprot:403332811